MSVKLVEVALPTKEASRKTLYPVTPTLSVDAVHVRSTELADVAVAFKAVGSVGAVRSPAVARVTVIVAVAVIPEESMALTVRTLLPEARSMPSKLHEVEPIAAPWPPRLLDHVTILMVLLEAGEAVPVSSRVGLPTVAEPVVDGEVIVIVGAVRLALRGTFQKKSLTVVTPPPTELLALATDPEGPVATARNRVELLEALAPETVQEVVPVASG